MNQTIWDTWAERDEAVKRAEEEVGHDLDAVQRKFLLIGYELGKERGKHEMGK